MSAGRQIDWSKYESASPAQIDFSKYAEAPKENSPVMDSLSKASSISRGPGWISQRLNEIKQGLTGAQEGSGLPKQPTSLGNVAELIGMLGTETANLGVGPKLAQGASLIGEAIPSSKNAGKIFDEVAEKVSSHPVDMTNELSRSASRIQQLSDTGSSMPMAARKFLLRVTDPDKPQLTYKEARDFYSNLSRISADEAQRLTPVMKRALSQFTYDLGKSIESTTARGDQLDKFQKAMSEYRNSMRVQNVLEELKDKVIKTLPWAAAAYGAKKLIEGR